MTELQWFDSHGVSHVSDQGIIELAYQDKLDTSLFEWQNEDSKTQYEKMSRFLDKWPYQFSTSNPQDRTWFTPDEYQKLDLREFVLARCKNSEERHRASLELDIIASLEAEPIFRHLIYLVEKWRSTGKVWGVGRGSSVSCFVLYVIGVNRINPLLYDLPLTDFFKV